MGLLMERRKAVAAPVAEFIIVVVVVLIALAAASYLISLYATVSSEREEVLKVLAELDSPSNTYATTYPGRFLVDISSTQSGGGYELAIEIKTQRFYRELIVLANVYTKDGGLLEASNEWRDVVEGNTLTLTITGLGEGDYPLRVELILYYTLD